MTKFEILGARMLIQALSRRAGVWPSKVVGHYGRKKNLTRLRVAIATELYGTEFSYPEIGALMGRDHSTIQTMVKGRVRRSKRIIYPS